METKWIDNLKEGDEVAIEMQGNYTRVSVRKVTPTQIVVEHGLADFASVRRFYRSTGEEVGSSRSWHSATLSMLTPELREKMEEKIKQIPLLLSVKAVAWGSLTSEQLSRILAIAREGKP